MFELLYNDIHMFRINAACASCNMHNSTLGVVNANDSSEENTL